jgi:hypothetical protein
MAAFPSSIIPSARTYSPGAFPHTAHGVYDGSQVRVRHSNTVLGVRLRLFFPAITTAELLTVIGHYAGQSGRFLPFAIPDDLLSGVATPADFTPVGHQWRYAARPTVEDISIVGGTNRHDLTIELETVPPENTIAQGARLRILATLQAGSAQLGTFFNAVASLSAGEATGGQALLLNASASLSAGLANNGSPFVDPFTAVASLSAGAASVGGPFSPADLSPVAWWDASDSSTITTSSGLITDWTDKSGNSVHLSQSTSGNRPTYTTAGINGLNVATWPSSDNSVFMASANASHTVKEFYVVARFANSAFSNYEGLVNPRTDPPGDWFTANNSGGGLFSTGGRTVYLNADNGTNRIGEMRTEMTSTCLFRWVNTSGTVSTTTGFCLGNDRSNFGLGRGWNGEICEVAIFSSSLASGDRADLETYLMDKWGI